MYAQASLHICAVSSEPLLFAHMKYGSRRRVRPKIRHLAPLDDCARAFKNEFTEDEKYHNLIRLKSSSSLTAFVSKVTYYIHDLAKSLYDLNHDKVKMLK